MRKGQWRVQRQGQQGWATVGAGYYRPTRAWGDIGSEAERAAPGLLVRVQVHSRNGWRTVWG